MNDIDILCEFKIKQNVGYMSDQQEEDVFEVPCRTIFIPPKQFTQLGRTEVSCEHCINMSILPTFRTIALCIPHHRLEQAMDVAYKINKFLESDEESITIGLNMPKHGFEQEITITKKQ